MSFPNEICNLATLRACEGISAMCSNTLATASIVIPANASAFFADVITRLAQNVRFLNDSADEIRRQIENVSLSTVPLCVRFDDNGDMIPVTDEAEKARIVEENAEAVKEAEELSL